MNAIRKQAAAARRRLLAERFFCYLPWTMTSALVVASVGAAIPKLVHLPVDPSIWLAGWIGGACALGLLVNVVLTLVQRPTLADAAAEIDRRFGLRERLSSALLLTGEDRETELGAALVADAERRAEQIDVRDKFQWGVRRRLLVPLLPALLAAALTWVPDRPAEQQMAQVDPQTVTRVKNSIKPLVEQVKKKRELAEKEGLNAAADLFRKLEGDLAKLQKDTKLDTKQTLAKLNDIKQQLADRMKELGDADALKKNLQNLEKLDAGPADKLADAMKEGDFEKAEKALEDLLKQLREGNMSAEDMKRLQKQLQQLQQAMAEAGQAHERAKQQLQEQIEQAQKSGDMQKAAQLQRKLEQLQAKDATMAQMQQMAQAMSQASQAMQQGKLGEAQEAMESLAAQLDQMNTSDAQLEELDDLLDSLSASKSMMMCKQCDGQGCSTCMGSSMMSMMSDYAQGQGQGAGARSEEEDDVDFFDSRVRDQMRRGETVYGGKVGGANRKGVSLVDVQQAVLTSLTEEPEPLDDTPLPKAQREHTRDFFNMLREGKPE